MKRIIACLLVVSICTGLAGCDLFHEHSFYKLRVVEEPVACMTGKIEEICIDCDETRIVDYPARGLVRGKSFDLNIEEFTERLAAIGARHCPGLTVNLRADDWSAVTELCYEGVRFCEITYYDDDVYLDNPYPTPMNEDDLRYWGIRHVNVLDFPDVPHAPNSFAAIAMTFDPLLTEADAVVLEEYLVSTRQSEYGNYMVASMNDVGYGHAYPINQLEYSGSIAIHAGVELPINCAHDPDYTFSGDGVPEGNCKKCGEHLYPAEDGWQYLTSMEVAEHSDASNGMDIAIGDWYDPVGAKYWGAMKFWVIDRPGWSNMEYIEYTLDDSYRTLSGTIVSSVDSDPDAQMWIEIYLDGELAYTSEKVGYYSYIPYMVDLWATDTVRICCYTDTDAEGYCVMTAAVF